MNTRRAVQEVVESAMGAQYSDAKLLIFHASIGHDYKELLDEASKLCPDARILSASCCGVVGKEGVSESMKDIALMAIKGNEFGVEYAVAQTNFSDVVQQTSDVNRLAFVIP